MRKDNLREESIIPITRSLRVAFGADPHRRVSYIMPCDHHRSDKPFSGMALVTRLGNVHGLAAIAFHYLINTVRVMVYSRVAGRGVAQRPLCNYLGA